MRLGWAAGEHRGLSPALTQEQETDPGPQPPAPCQTPKAQGLSPIPGSAALLQVDFRLEVIFFFCWFMFFFLGGG